MAACPAGGGGALRALTSPSGKRDSRSRKVALCHHCWSKVVPPAGFEPAPPPRRPGPGVRPGAPKRAIRAFRGSPTSPIPGPVLLFVPRSVPRATWLLSARGDGAPAPNRWRAGLGDSRRPFTGIVERKRALGVQLGSIAARREVRTGSARPRPVGRAPARAHACSLPCPRLAQVTLGR